MRGRHDTLGGVLRQTFPRSFLASAKVTAIYKSKAARKPPISGGFRAVSSALPVKGRIDEVDVLLVHLLFCQLHSLAEALEVDDFPLPQKPDDIVHIRIVGQAQDVVIGEAGFLLWCDLVRTTFFCRTAELDTYIETLLPSVSDDFIGTAKLVMRPRHRKMLRNLLTFRFKKHPRYNLPPKRLRMIEEQIQKRARLLLED